MSIDDSGRCLAEIGAMTPTEADAALPSLPELPFPLASHPPSARTKSFRSRDSTDDPHVDHSEDVLNSDPFRGSTRKSTGPTSVLARQAGPPPQEHYFETANADGKVGFRKEDTARKWPSTTASSSPKQGIEVDGLDELGALDVGVGEEV